MATTKTIINRQTERQKAARQVRTYIARQAGSQTGKLAGRQTASRQRIIMVIKSELEWFSTYRAGKPPKRLKEIADLALTLDESGTHGLLVNGCRDPQGEWRYYVNSEEASFLVVKMNSISPPEQVRYYGFTEWIKNNRGEQVFICDYSAAADPTKLDQDIDSYLAKFLKNDFERPQRYHIELAHKPVGAQTQASSQATFNSVLG